MAEAILNVLAVLALIVVGGFIIYVLSGLIISIIDKKSVKLFSRKDEDAKEVQEETKLLTQNAEELVLDFDDELPVEDSNVDFDKAEEEMLLAKKEPSVLEQRMELINKRDENEKFGELEDEDDEEESDDLEEMFKKLIADINKEAISNETEEKPEEEVKEELEEEPEEEPEETVEEEIVNASQPDNNVEKISELEQQIAELKELLAKQKAETENIIEENEELNKALENQAPIIVGEELDSLETLTARLETLTARLKQTEKELSANKKEYIPLKRIKKSLENDKAKLRRKEAIIVKQKTVLFGVNNYIVDPEKEKKLAEDSEALDALRLSVQHSLDIMKENEDRFPILERVNIILTQNVQDIKSDIALVEEKIKALQDKQN